MAFIPSLSLSASFRTPSLSSASSLRATSLSSPSTSSLSVSTSRRTVTKMEASPSVPFLPKPDNLSPDMPGYAGFDPFGFSNYVNVKFLQEAEIKHCRICMLAVLGIFVTEFYTLPFYPGAPKLAAGIHDWGVSQGSMQQLLLWISIFEAVVGVPALIQMLTLDSPRRPGEFAFDPLGLGKTDAAFKKNQTAELVNGRLCMIVVGGLLHQEFLTGLTPIQQLVSGKILP